jgi:hypothetical protein
MSPGSATELEAYLPPPLDETSTRTVPSLKSASESSCHYSTVDEVSFKTQQTATVTSIMLLREKPSSLNGVQIVHSRASQGRGCVRMVITCHVIFTMCLPCRWPPSSHPCPTASVSAGRPASESSRQVRTCQPQTRSWLHAFVLHPNYLHF